MKKLFICLIALISIKSLYAQATPPITSTMGKVSLSFNLDADGSPVYSVTYGDKPVIKPSHMGIRLQNDSAFDKHFTVLNVEKKSVDETWQPVWGELSHIRNHYEQVTVHLQQQNAPLPAAP